MLPNKSLLLLFILCALEDQSAIKVIITRQESSNLNNVYLIKLDKKNLYYRVNPNKGSLLELSRKAVKGVFFYQPKLFADALDLYKKGEFKQAQLKFNQCKEQSAPYKEFLGNYSTLSAYYEIECARRLGDLNGMDELLNFFNPETLDNENYLTQLEIYSFWTAVSRESWRRVLRLSEAWEQKLIPPSQRTQIRYCEALATKALGSSAQTLEALYAVIAGSKYSEPELIESVYSMALEILLRNVRIPKRAQTDPYTAPLQEAISLAKVWNDSLGKSRPLPERYRKLLKL